MKKWLSLLLALAMMLALLVGCGRDKNNQADTQADPQPAQEQENSTAPESSIAGDNSVSFDDAPQQTQGDNSVSVDGDTAPAGESETAPTQSVTAGGEWSPPV